MEDNAGYEGIIRRSQPKVYFTKKKEKGEKVERGKDCIRGSGIWAAVGSPTRLCLS